MTARLWASIEIARPHNMAAAMACIAAGFYIAGGSPLSLIFYPMLITGLVAGCGNMINDFFDADIDAVNKPRRPIPSGRLAPEYVKLLYAACSALVTAAAVLLLPPSMILFVLAWQVLLFLYGWKLKRFPLAGNLLVAAVGASAFLGGALVAGAPMRALFPFLFAFFFVMGRELVKEVEDIEGDRLAGARTIAVVSGAGPTLRAAALFLFICILAAPVPTLVNAYGRLYCLLMELTVVPGLLVASYTVLGSPDRAQLNRVSWILKGEMFLGILAMSVA
jgi:geranylgeranylglycerol-phosphate geranylgeranyltransferase